MTKQLREILFASPPPDPVSEDFRADWFEARLAGASPAATGGDTQAVADTKISSAYGLGNAPQRE